MEVFAPVRLWHLTSLDAPTVAVVWALAFARVVHVSLPLWVPCLLALGAWTVYIGDRLLDARARKAPLRERHRFHWKHRRVFIVLAVSAIVVAIALIAFAVLHHQMPMVARERNSVLVAAALTYFASVHGPRRIFNQFALPKELLVGILFTLACAAPAWARSPGHRLAVLLPVLVFVLLAWLNCYAIESWESALLSRTRILPLATLLGIATVCCAAICFVWIDSSIALLLATAGLSALLLAALDRVRSRLTPVTLRAFADVALLTPIAVLLRP